MPSADFVYDLVDKLDKENFDYLVVVFKKNKTGDEAPITMIYNLEDENSKEIMFDALTVFERQIKNREDEE